MNLSLQSRSPCIIVRYRSTALEVNVETKGLAFFAGSCYAY